MNRLALLISIAVTLPVSMLRSQHPAPTNKTVPAVACRGGVDCASGQNLCKRRPARGPGFATITLSDTGYSITSDDGPYVHGNANVVAIASHAAALLLDPVKQGDTSRPRRIRVDLSRPVAGDIGVPLGVITDSVWVDMNAQWKTEADFTQYNMADIPVGTMVDAEQASVGFAIDGVPHVLQMGPQPWGHCYSNGTAIVGTGTTRATIARTDASTWVVDLPPGSIGRLFDIHLHDPHAVNRGLYYVSVHFVARRHVPPAPLDDR